jgi:hypothetical protein
MDHALFSGEKPGAEAARAAAGTSVVTSACAMIARRTVSLAYYLGSDRVLDFSVSGEGSAIVLSLSRETADHFGVTRDPRGERWYFEQGPKEPYDAVALLPGDRTYQRLRLRGLTAWFPHIQALPNGEILIVNARCDHRNEKDNGFVYGPDGLLRRSFPLGDGIEHVQTLTDGRIWIGYFDEGIFGNEGWQNKPWVRDAARSGLACFDATGKLLWRYRHLPDTRPICDCYALNATDDSVWTQHYPSFPLARISPHGVVHYWECEFTFAQALAISDQTVLFWDGGALPNDIVSCVVQRIEDDVLTATQDLLLTLPDGSELDGRTATVIGRGHYLHAFHGLDWHRYDLSTFQRSW